MYHALLVFVFALGVAGQRVSVLAPKCPSSTVFEAGINQCSPCRNNSLSTGASCVCSRGFALQRDPLSYRVSCVDCVAQGLAPSLIVESDGFRRCVPCGDPVDFNVTCGDVSASTFVDGRCSCPADHVLVEHLGARLPVQVCRRCPAGQVSSSDGLRCIECGYPFRLDSNSRRCVCSDGFSLISDGSCVASALVQLINSGLSSTLQYRIPLKNLDNSGSDGDAVSSVIIDTHLTTAALGCQNGNQTQCNLLANMCVLSHYSVDAAPCAFYRQLQAIESCRGFECETPKTLPWLYYLRSSAAILQDENIQIRVRLATRMRFILSAFSWDGRWLGNTLVTTQLHLCDFSSSGAREFFAVGSDRVLSCHLNLRWFLGAPKTAFYELYLQDNDALRDIPVLRSYSNKDINPSHVHDSVLFRAGASADLTPQVDGYVRRFYLYDNIGGVSSGDVNTGKPEYITVARNIKLLISLQPTHLSRIFTPLLIVQYATFRTGQMYRETSFDLNELPFMRTNTSSGLFTQHASTSIKFTMDTKELERSLMITLIVFCCVCFVTAWIRANGWMRRQQNMMVGTEALIRFLVYYCQHLSNMFFLIVIITCGYMYIFYKHQSSVEYAMPVNNSYIWGMLYTAVVAKGIVVLYRIHEQCNADIFVIDWERSKGALLRENKDVPISMWRSTFIANEFNELQVLRGWNPLFCMIIIMLFLEGQGYVNLASTVPWVETTLSETAPPHPFLRIAVSSFFWIVVALVIYFLQWYIYYKFLEVHPLRAFVDLCSVSNISIMILLEPQWGFYIHGESIHAHSDISVEEFQENLKREAQGNLPARGLGGQDLCQTFEVFIGTVLRQRLYVCYAELYQEYMKALNGEAGPVDARHHRRCFEFLTGGPGQTRTFTPETLVLKERIQNAFKESVRAAEKSLFAKFPLHNLLDYPPNIMFMNGTYAGEASLSRDVFFFDDVTGFGRSLLISIDLDIFLFYVLLFLSIDTSLYNTYIAMTITYIVDLLLVYYRGKEGQANIGAKTLFDDRFFL